MSLTKVKWPMATGNQLELTPEFDLFPTTEIWGFRNLDGTVPIYKLSSHSPAVPGYGGDDLYQMQKLALYTHNGAGGSNKRLDIDANAQRATTWFQNSKAFVITSSTGPDACFMVGVDYPGYDAPNNIFDPTTCSAFFPTASAIFRKDGANKDIVILENRNGVNGDQANLGFILEDPDTGNEVNMGQIKIVGVEQRAASALIGSFRIQPRFGSENLDTLTVYRKSVIINGTENSSYIGALTSINQDDTEAFAPTFYATNDSGTSMAALYNGAGGGWNAADTVFRITKNTSTSRSINAAGTINSSGADYAEYMEKAGDFSIAKGDICGINSNGKLTNVYSDAVSFVVKSTDPSYVGNDSWAKDIVEPIEPVFEYSKYSGSENPGPKPVMDDAPASELTDETIKKAQEEYHQKLFEWAVLKEKFDQDRASYDAGKAASKANFETNEYAQYQEQLSDFNQAHENARANMDRIAFCGQVPVNVTGATAGQYIIPKDDNGAIIGEAISNPTFEQYQMAVGKVIAIEADNRAKIIVKIS